MKLSYLALLVIVPISILGGCMMNIEKNHWIKDGTKSHRNFYSIDGNIHIGENSEVAGNCRTIDGWIDVGANSKVRNLNTIDGKVRVRKNAVVNGYIKVIDGEIYCESGVKVKGYVETTDADIKLEGTVVEDSLSTSDGNIKLYDNTTVMGNIKIKKRYRIIPDHIVLYIEIDNSIVEGDIINKDSNTEVIIYISNGGQVKGQVVNAKVEKL